ncbi:hypothetical protein ALC56_07710 [Trachymyrmex septentrionalis]|uniref:Uncharacterized protein n=1 Tax=Trachymyrmex septentrionalis TaxID=34720 RepID=A0A151JVK2_9HYME|nr:PREDICTED: uncharacterized protein LOC108749780 [Trachymyrmex septentrionalis]KYN37914.1 hypothetical protein ALC56_07710 [Trachymyrmex septentrionalis]
MTISTSGNREHSTSPQSPTLRGCDVSSNTTSKRAIGADSTARSASFPQLTTKIPRSKVYRKTSLKSSSLKNEVNVGGDGNGTTERNGVVRYMSIAAEKKQKRKSLADRDVDVRCENKWNSEDIHITCNPLSTPYPYSTPAATTTTTTTTVTTTSKTTATMVESDEEPKSRSCGSFLPILALIPHSVISFQYLSPKMKFSWWRNKIS